MVRRPSAHCIALILFLLKHWSRLLSWHLSSFLSSSSSSSCCSLALLVADRCNAIPLSPLLQALRQKLIISLAVWTSIREHIQCSHGCLQGCWSEAVSVAVSVCVHVLMETENDVTALPG